MANKETYDVFFNSLDKELQDWLYECQLKSLMEATTGFSQSELTEEKRLERIEKAKDYKYFKNKYFSPKIFRQGFFKSPVFHDRIREIMDMPGIHLLIGPRGFAKTTEARIKLLHDLLYGKRRFAGTYSEDIDVAQSWLAFLGTFLMRGRILQDFHPEIRVFNKDEIRFTCCNFPLATAIVKAFATKRSVRGQLDELDRPEVIIGDDIETLDSSFTEDALEKRMGRVQEAFESLDNRNANFTILCNNFKTACLANRLLMNQENGVEHPFIHVHLFSAWKNGKSLWHSKFPARSEDELKIMLKCTSEESWAGNYQGRPIESDGDLFKREYYTEYEELPDDLVGVIYTDQNLAKKGKGDTTAITPLYHSRKTGIFYVVDAYCQNTTKGSILFNAILDRYNAQIVEIGMDGNVTQESYWENLLEAEGKLDEAIYWLKEFTQFKRYKVDDLAIQAQLLWENRKIQFPKGFSLTKTGAIYTKQVFSFRGKKAGKKDDAPDTIICAVQMLFERGLGRKGGNSDFEYFVVENFGGYI